MLSCGTAAIVNSEVATVHAILDLCFIISSLQDERKIANTGGLRGQGLLRNYGILSGRARVRGEIISPIQSWQQVKR
jgi:hypothetical protein